MHFVNKDVILTRHFIAHSNSVFLYIYLIFWQYPESES